MALGLPPQSVQRLIMERNGLDNVRRGNSIRLKHREPESPSRFLDQRHSFSHRELRVHPFDDLLPIVSADPLTQSSQHRAKLAAGLGALPLGGLAVHRRNLGSQS
jgi:hypothetical protein